MVPAMTDRMASRILHALKARGPQPAGVLAAQLDVTAVAVRQHLDRLIADGLVAFEDRRGTVGRPKRVWALTDRGHARFPDNHAGLTLEMLDGIRAVFGEDGIDRIIAHREVETEAAYRRRLTDAQGLAERVHGLAEVRSEEGYMASVETDADGNLVLVENHCPICAAARACQGLCRSELAVFRRVLGPDVEVERIEHVLAGARRCAYRIRTRPAPAG